TSAAWAGFLISPTAWPPRSARRRSSSSAIFPCPPAITTRMPPAYLPGSSADYRDHGQAGSASGVCVCLWHSPDCAVGRSAGLAAGLVPGSSGRRTRRRRATPISRRRTCGGTAGAGGAATAVAAELRDPGAVQGLVDRAVTDTGRLDVMVNNAGVSFRGPLADGDPEAWREMLEVNVLALAVGSRAALRAMRACG